MYRFALAGLMLAALLSFTLVIARMVCHQDEFELSNFSTSLHGRTRAQRHNALLAAMALNGKVILPNEVFSFNSVVGPWSRERGYKRAPVSYGGEMILAFGGGVCQTSSTLYNAALLAGLEIVERHPHQWVPPYVPPGRDAAVAYGIADLKLRNPYNEPIKIKFCVNGDSLKCNIVSSFRPKISCIIESKVKWHDPHAPIVLYDREVKSGRVVRVGEGMRGCTVRTYRTLISNGELATRELISVDEYKAMSGWIKVGTGE